MSSLVTPIDEYLARQADLSAVERFARTDVEGRTGRWSELIPLSTPAPGEQYRFEVDLDACTGCKACVTACHSLNGLDDGESFRSVGLLLAGPDALASSGPAQQAVTTSCHHCADPGCLNGCPAEAYEKDPVTGIVRHLDDACIGCQYCTLTCPYDVPLYNDRLGIVRKCDLCADRLAEGEAPACVQGCPTAAITVTTVVVDREPAAAQLLPGSAPSELTTPTTRYRGAALAGAAVPADAANLAPQPAHLPLVAMLVLSQLSVGALVAAALFGRGWTSGQETGAVVVAALTAAVAALASFAHLGQPRKAWRVVLGWRHSWLSREALLFGACVGLAGLAAVQAGSGSDPSAVVTAAAVVGVVAVGSSAMIYVVTGRRFWEPVRTATAFAGTVALGATATLAVVGAVDDGSLSMGAAPAAVTAVVLLGKFLVERSVADVDDVDLRRSAALLDGPLAPIVHHRLTTLAAAIVLFFGAALLDGVRALAVLLAAAGVVAVVISELRERSLFFQACAASTMPGAVR